MQEVNDIWGQLLHRLLAITGEQWRCLPPELTSLLSATQWSAIRIHTVNSDLVEKLLQTISADDRCEVLSAVSESERIEILRCVNDDDLWLHLPLHRASDGSLVALDRESTYLVAAKSSIPDSFSELIVAIPIPKDNILSTRYRTLIPQWDSTTAITVALRQVAPSKYGTEILDALAAAGTERLGLNDDTLGALRSRNWLQTSIGPRQPVEVINIPGIEDELARLVNDPQVGGIFVDIGMVADEVRKHAAFGFLSELVFTNFDEAIGNLAICLEEASTYHIGNIDLPENLDELLKGLDDVEPSLLPGITFLHRISERIPSDGRFKLAESMSREVSIETLRRVLITLADMHEKDGAKQKPKRLAVHALYLRTFVRHREFQTDWLRGLRLLNGTGQWRQVESLSFEGMSLDTEDVLNKEQADIIRDHVSSERRNSPGGSTNGSTISDMTQATRAPDSSISQLLEYFRPWSNYVRLLRPRLVASCLCLVMSLPLCFDAYARVSAAANRQQCSRPAQLESDRRQWRWGEYPRRHGQDSVRVSCTRCRS